MGTNKNLDGWHGPAELEPGGAVKRAVRCTEKQRLGGAQPVREQQAGAEIEESGSFGSATEREAVFGAGGADEICARRGSGKDRRAAPRGPGRYGVGAKLTRTKPAHEFIA